MSLHYPLPSATKILNFPLFSELDNKFFDVSELNLNCTKINIKECQFKKKHPFRILTTSSNLFSDGLYK